MVRHTIFANNTTTITEEKNCLVEELYGTHSEETALFRCVRDNLLIETPAGQEIITLYHQLSPQVVKTMQHNEVFRKQVKSLIDGILLVIKEE